MKEGKNARLTTTTLNALKINNISLPSSHPILSSSQNVAVLFYVLMN